MDSRFERESVRRHMGNLGQKQLDAIDMMTSERLNIPESVADFIEGRTPKTVGARHYMSLKRKAIQFYPRYGEYVKSLRNTAGLN